MALISIPSHENVEPQVAAIYGQIEEAMGRVPNALRLYSVSPGLLEQQWAQIGYYRQHPSLGFHLLALIRMLVSQDNQCAYCVGFNEAMLIQVGGLDAELVAAIKQDPDEAPLSGKDKALLRFVLRATRDPLSIRADDVDELRGLGWTDSEMLDAVQHGARNVAVDVVFNTFKIDRDF